MTFITRAVKVRNTALLAVFASCNALAGVLAPPSVVNTYVAGNQSLREAAAAVNGDSLVLWNDVARGGYYFLRRFDGTGTTLDAEWFAGIGAEKVALDKVGNLAVTSVEPDGTGRSIFVSTFNRNGTPRLAKFKVNTVPASYIGSGRVAINRTGQMAVFWLVDRNDGTYGLMARTFSPSGVPTSPETLISSPTFSNLLQDGHIDDAGNVGALWVTGTANSDVYFRRFANNGSPLTSPLLVNTYTTGAQASAWLAMNSSGAAVVTWESGSQDGSHWGVYGQRFSSSGVKLGPEFRVNDTTEGDQTWSSVAMSAEGHFAVTWVSGNTLFIKQYRADGTALAPEQALYNPGGSAVTRWTRIAMDPAGVATIGWQNYSADTGYDAYSMRFVLDTQPVATNLSSALPVAGISSAQGGWKYFKIVVPSGKSSLRVQIAGPSGGDADIYGRFGGIPTLVNAEVRSERVGSNEGFVINGVPPGTWYFGLYGYAPYSGVTLTATAQ